MTSVTAIPRLAVIEADQRTSISLGSLGFMCKIEAFSVQPISLSTFVEQFSPSHSNRGKQLEEVAIHPKAVDGQGLHAIAGV